MTDVRQLSVACVDVGAPGNIGWAVLSGAVNSHGGDPEEFIVAALGALARGERLALGFECPLFVPLRDDPLKLTKARQGELGVCWSGGPGGGVLPAGIVQTRWFLSQIAKAKPNLSATTRWGEFESEGLDLFLWEAFIASSQRLPEAPDLSHFPGSVGKPHERDAIAGALKAKERLFGSLPPLSDLAEAKGISLIGLHLLSLGLTQDKAILDECCLVVSCRKPA